ncbi:hypothetical protein DL96DRAFT_1815997 [Flagelloscypha sp. PMI_526]|nr:hypothetical protein DL96DRAFT_1815997 [Flagelloscypha sp. PMI_526]
MPAIPALDLTLGALLVGVILAGMLYGISIAQGYWYFDTYKNDRAWLKSFVGAVLIFEAVHQALISHVIYTDLVTEYANPLALDHYLKSLSIQALFGMMTMVCVQSFFCIRIWTLSNRNYYFVALPATLTLANLVLGIYYSAVNIPEVSITVAFSKWLSESQAINGLSAGTDIIIAISMVTLLYRSKTGLSSTHTLLNKLMLYAINTGAVTSIASILTVIFTVVFGQGNMVYGAVYFMTGRLYLISMLASLNAREGLRKGMALSVNMSDFTSSRTGTNTRVENSTFPGVSDAKRGFDMDPKDTVVMIRRGVTVHSDAV